jgi:hypothetical protein
MIAWYRPKIIAVALLAGIPWQLAGELVSAQPAAMPITDLENRNPAGVPPGAAGPQSNSNYLPAQYLAQPPGPALGPGQPFAPAQPVPSIAPPPGTFDAPPPQLPQQAGWVVPWTWQVLPDGLMYKDYLASNEEARLSTALGNSKQIGWVWDTNLGAHVGILRYGTQDAAWPEGWQFDVEGVALVRLDSGRNLVSSDFRAGFPLTRREGPWEFKFGYYHLSSHLGDLYIESHPGIERINYKREQLVLGVAYRPIQELRFYSEASWAFAEDGGSQPWEFQFGIDYSPVQPNGIWGAPFAAFNTKIFQDLDYSGNFTVEAGWQWRGCTGHTLRTGVEYFDGYSFQRQFYNQYQSFVAGGVWYDF